MGCSAPVSRRVPGSVMSMASALSAASLGPGAGGLLQQPLHFGLELVEALADGLLGLGGRGLQPAAGNLVEPALLAPQPLQAKSLNRFGRCPARQPHRAPGGAARQTPGRARPRRMPSDWDIASFIMRKQQDKGWRGQMRGEGVAGCRRRPCHSVARAPTTAI